jgi:hypothetical protein
VSIESSSSPSDALKRAEDLLAKDVHAFQPRLRIRWWNIVLISLSLVGLASLVAPIAWPETRDGLWGNVLAETWGILATVALAWVVFKRFQVERLDSTTFTLYDPIRALRQLALAVYPEAINASPTKHFSIEESERSRFRYLADLTFARSTLYSRFLELEDIGRLDACATHAFHLSLAATAEDHNERTAETLGHLLLLYLSATGVLETTLSNEIVRNLQAARDTHIEAWRGSTISASVE